MAHLDLHYGGVAVYSDVAYAYNLYPLGTREYISIMLEGGKNDVLWGKLISKKTPNKKDEKMWVPKEMF